MCDLSLCRMCLAHDVTMYKIVNTKYQQLYEKLTNVPLVSGERPVTVCYLCYGQLKRCHRLAVTTAAAERLLTQLIDNNQLTLDILKGQRQKDVLTCTRPYLLRVGVDGDGDGDGARDDKSDPGSDPNASDSESESDVPLARMTRGGGRRVRSLEHTREELLSPEQQLEALRLRASSHNYLHSPYKCDRCFRGFHDVRTHRNHRTRHDAVSGDHECDVCHMRYPTARQMRIHADNAHRRRYHCTRCGNVTHTANQAREHEKWHGGHAYHCRPCGLKFRKPTSYLSHVRKRHATEHVCVECGDSFHRRRGLAMHASRAHRLRPQADGDAQPRRCDSCDVTFRSAEAWTRHVLTSRRHAEENARSTECPVCGVAYAAEGARAHLRRHARAILSREVSDAPASVPAARCEQCAAEFTGARGFARLAAHVRRAHLGLRYDAAVVCETCGRRCASAAALRYHQRTHTGERPYECAACAKRFADANQLRIHTRTHTGERPYVCAVCGKRFTQKPALNRHCRVHTGARPYSCDYCGKCFTQSNSAKLHMRTVHLRAPAAPAATASASAATASAPATALANGSC